MKEKQAYQSRTAIVHFGSTKQDYLSLVESSDHRPLIAHLQVALKVQLTQKHKPECHDNSRYTIHSMRNRQLQGWLGQMETIPICRARCQCCRAVFTVLPSFMMRYRRQDTDCLGKLMELNLGMGLTLRETATIYSWLGTERGWKPGWVWSLVQWLGNLLPVCLLLMQMGLPLPTNLLSDEKFALLGGEKIYLFLVSQGELIWYGEWMESVDESTFQRTITQFLVTMNHAGQISGELAAQAKFAPDSATTDGW